MCDLSSCPSNAARSACISPDRDGAPIIFPESREVFSREGAKTRAPSADGWRVASASASRHRWGWEGRYQILEICIEAAVKHFPLKRIRTFDLGWFSLFWTSESCVELRN